jgi:hypothetical protein
MLSTLFNQTNTNNRSMQHYSESGTNKTRYNGLYNFYIQLCSTPANTVEMRRKLTAVLSGDRSKLKISDNDTISNFLGFTDAEKTQFLQEFIGATDQFLSTEPEFDPTIPGRSVLTDRVSRTTQYELD